ncbi:hypothetical protein CPB86DRAFT_702212 [Serendipita vermifera]|nr:hypothetical protein CPB86DRAFT_702212 [Serendipita vermifera]
MPAEPPDTAHISKPKKATTLSIAHLSTGEYIVVESTLTLTLKDGKKVAASDHQLQLNPNFSLTYSQINCLAGDFYGTNDPISDGTNDKDRIRRFKDAYNTLAQEGPRMPKEAKDILDLVKEEADLVNKAVKKGKEPSTGYAKLSRMNDARLYHATYGREGIPTYLGLLKINWDHFGKDARLAYNAGHAAAIQEAIEGNLETAYAMNAFADHFLQDSFCSGHLRTPRRLLHSAGGVRDLCAMYMHDEDNAIGLSVTDPQGKSWTMYGDKRFLDSVNEENRERCVCAVQASINEIYWAYRHPKAKVPSPAKYEAWKYAPTLKSANGHQELAPLFKTVGKSIKRRKNLENRREWDFTDDFSYKATLAQLSASKLWKYPITLD